MNQEPRTTADIVFLFPPTGDLARLWSAVPGRKPLTLALAELGYALARSNGRKVYLVDQKGDAQPLRAKIGDGPVDATFAAVDTTTLPTVTEVRAMLRKARRDQKADREAPVRNPAAILKAEPVEPRVTPSSPLPPLPPPRRATRFDRSIRTYPFPSKPALKIVASAPPASASYVPAATKYPGVSGGVTSSDDTAAPRPNVPPAPQRPSPILPPALLQQRKEMAERFGAKGQVAPDRASPANGPALPHKPPMFSPRQKAVPLRPLPSLPKQPRTVWIPDKATEEFFDQWVAEQKSPNFQSRSPFAPKAADGSNDRSKS